MPNPYDPQTPARPEYFGCREHVLKTVRERIIMAKEHKKSGGVLIFGHRGVGKTSLINNIIIKSYTQTHFPQLLFEKKTV